MAEKDWNWIDKAPIVRLFNEEKRRIRWLTEDDAERLLNELPAEAEHLLVVFLRFQMVGDGGE